MELSTVKTSKYPNQFWDLGLKSSDFKHAIRLEGSTFKEIGSQILKSRKMDNEIFRYFIIKSKTKWTISKC